MGSRPIGGKATGAFSPITHGEDGYTLLEMVIVVTIIAALFAIAVLSLSGLRSRGFDVEARTNLRNAAVIAKFIFSERGTYGELNCARMRAAEPVFNTKIPCQDGDIEDPDSRHHGIVQIVGADGYEAEIQVFTKGSREEYRWIASRDGDRLILR